MILSFPRAKLAGLSPMTLPLEEQFAALHDRSFPNTHAPAATLLAGGEPIWVEVDGASLLGYVTLKLRPEHDDAQIDYVAVHEDARGRGASASPSSRTCAATASTSRSEAAPRA